MPKSAPTIIDISPMGATRLSGVPEVSAVNTDPISGAERNPARCLAGCAERLPAPEGIQRRRHLIGSLERIPMSRVEQNHLARGCRPPAPPPISAEPADPLGRV